jgi:hypothetical protein
VSQLGTGTVPVRTNTITSTDVGIFKCTLLGTLEKKFLRAGRISNQSLILTLVVPDFRTSIDFLKEVVI